MERELVLQILGLTELTDEETVKRAYHTKLRTVNPEDDQEGFRRLREAYESALALLRDAETEDAEREKTPVDLWLERADAVYQDFRTRGELDAWEEILEDPVCQDLDTSLEARDGMLGYLLSHFFLPRRIWRRLDREFQIVQDKESLKERYPADFLDYAEFYTEHDYYIDFDQMRLRENADAESMNVDGYIQAYQGLRAACDRGEWKDAVRQADEIEAYGVFYPWEAAERLRIHAALYRTALDAPEMTEEESRKQRDALLAEAAELTEYWPDSQYIMTQAGNVQWTYGDHEKAFACWQKAPDNYEARCGLIRYWLENARDAQKAKESVLDLMEESNDEHLSEYLAEANRFLIAGYEDKIRVLPEGNERRETELEIAWCFFQNREFEKSLEILERMPFREYIPQNISGSFGTTPDENLIYSYYNLKGRVLAAMSRFQEAVPELEVWLRMILATEDNGTQEAAKRFRRKGSAYLMLGWSRYQTGAYEEAAGLLEKGIPELTVLSEKLSCMNSLAEVFLAMNACEKAIDVCGQILSLEKNYYPAYLNRQEAYFRLQNGQQVVDDYYRAVEIYPGYYKPYLLAEKVFFFCHQYEDVLDVIKRAEENQVEFSDQMKLYCLKARRNLAGGEEERREIFADLLSLKAAVDREKTDLEDISELKYEMALIKWDDGRLEEALGYLNKAIHENPSRLQYFMVRGEILRDAHEPYEALQSYEQAKEDYEDTPAWHYGKGCCYGDLGNEEMALQYFRNAAEADPSFRDVNEKIADIYMQRYRCFGNEDDFERAVRYMDREVENWKSCYTLVHRGLLYMEAMRLPEAISDFEKALTYNSDDWASYNNLGYCYKHLKQFQKSIEMYERSLECLDKTGEKKLLPYSNMADCYEILRDYGKAVECYRKDLEWFPKELSFYKEIGNLYRYMGRYEEAAEAYKKNMEDKEYLLCLGDVCVAKGKMLQARYYYRKSLQCDPERSYQRYTDCADRLFHHFGDNDGAMCLLKKAEEMNGRSVWKTWDDQRIRNLMLQARIQYLEKRPSEAARCARQALDLMLRGCISERIYVSYPAERPQRLSKVGECYLYMGDKKKALAYFSQTRSGLRCKYCREPECYEGLVGEMIFQMGEENWSEALACGEEALKICPNDLELQSTVQRIRGEI